MISLSLSKKSNYVKIVKDLRSRNTSTEKKKKLTSERTSPKGKRTWKKPKPKNMSTRLRRYILKIKNLLAHLVFNFQAHSSSSIKLKQIKRQLFIYLKGKKTCCSVWTPIEWFISLAIEYESVIDNRTRRTATTKRIKSFKNQSAVTNL